MALGYVPREVRRRDDAAAREVVSMIEHICCGCEHCGCDPTDREDFCEVCDDCDPCECPAGFVALDCPEHGRWDS